MNSDQPQPDVPGLDEDLVAYLDGELDDAASRRLEARLATDDSARQRLRSLAMSWDLLDNLPRAATDESFTRTTVELIANDARRQIAAEEAAIPVRNKRRWIAGAAAALAAAMIGFVAVVVAWPDSNEQLLRDLPVVKNLELYEVAPQDGAIEFLRSLDTQELFIGEAIEDLDQSGWGTTTKAVSREELLARRETVEALSTDEKNELRKLYERFRAQGEDEKDRLRELDAALRSDPEGARLLAVLQSYHYWLPTLSPLERANLLKLPSDKAIEEIERLKQQQVQSLARSGRSRQGPLRWRDADTINRWLQERALRRSEEILAAKGTPEDRDWFQGLSEDRKGRFLMALSMRGEPWPPKPPTLDEKEWRDLLDQIAKRSPAIKELFNSQGKVAENHDSLKALEKDARKEALEDIRQATTLEAKQKVLFKWHHEAQRAWMAFGGGVSPEELKRFMEEELTEEERKKLMGDKRIPTAAEFQRSLRWAYFKRDFPPGWQPPFKGGRHRGKEEGRGPDHGSYRGFDESRRGKPPRFDRDSQQRNDDERRDNDERRGPQSERQRRDRADGARADGDRDNRE